MSDQIWKPHTTVAAIAKRGDRYLMVEEYNSLGETVVNQPAGHLEADETLVEACMRETMEETGWQFKPTALIGLYRWISPRDGETFLRFCFAGELGEQVSERPPDSDIIRSRWLTRAELDQVPLRSVLVLSCIDDFVSGKSYPLELLQDVMEPTIG
ncbi:MAG: NUDIX hydrolase [Immundisolibacteraceae bacterium]|nr:NUDIX hydrolase [Immundisolibacteraceae bacterium]